MSLGTHLVYHFMRYGLCYPVGRTWLRLSASNTHHLPGRGPFILAANHVSHIDPWILGRYVATPVAWMATRLWYDGSWWRSGFRKMCGAIPVDIEGPDLSALAALRVLREGGVVGIFPEGQRSWDGELQDGHPGVVLLAALAGVPIVPAAICGAHESLPRGARFPKPGRIRVGFGPPLGVPRRIASSGSEADLQLFTCSLMDQIGKLLADLRDGSASGNGHGRPSPGPPGG